MRIPLPERFATRHVIIFATLFFLVEVAEGTNLAFALLVFCYVCLFALAFNFAKGIFYPSGAWIFFTGMLTCLAGLVYKCFLNEPAETNLEEPVVTMTVYVLSMAGTALAAYVTASFRPKKALLQDFSVGGKMKQSAAGCFFFGILLNVLTSNRSHESATLVSAFAQLNQFPQLAILLATVYEIKSSNGKRSTNWIVWISGISLFINGLLNFSKEGIFICFSVWLIPCIVLRYNFRKVQTVLLAVMFGLVMYYLVPYSQYGRQGRSEDSHEQYLNAWTYLQELPEVRRLYLESTDVAGVGHGPHLYNEPQGIMDRLQMLSFDDAIIAYTDRGNYEGLAPTYTEFYNAVPRFLWPSKPVYQVGNVYGRQIGVISSDDNTTGISFSPTGDAYHQVGWYGPVILQPLVFLMLFLVTDSLSGDVRNAPWGLLFVSLSVHMAPEGLLGGAIYEFTFGAEAVLFAAILSSAVFPRIVALVMGGDRTRVRKGAQFGPTQEALLLREAMRRPVSDPAAPPLL